MRQVMMVSLGDNAYNIDEQGYRALRKYLDLASAGLKNDPDAAEILADLERAIGEKCAGVLKATKNVVSAEDIDRILREVGPVEGADGAAPGPEEHDAPFGMETAKTVRRRIKGSQISGVCAGLADYFGLDVLIVRLGFVALTLVTGGAGVVMYIIMAIVVPADTSTGAPHGLAPSKIAMIAVITILFFAIAFPLFVSGTGMGMHGPGVTELLVMLFMVIAFFGVMAVIAAVVVMVLVRYLRPDAR